MAKVIFFSLPAHGHINPTLPLIKELVLSGEEVIYYSTDEFKEKIESANATYKKYDQYLIDHLTNKFGKKIASLHYIVLKTTHVIVEKLLKETKHIAPDYIIHDAICPWGKYIASICGIPAITSVTTFAFSHRGFDLFQSIKFIRNAGADGLFYYWAAQKYQRLLKNKYGIEKGNLVETMMNEEDLNIVYTSREFQPHSNLFDIQRFQFIGPSVTERENDPDKTNYSKMKRPIIYVSMGTIWKDQFDSKIIIDALRDLNCTIIISQSCDNNYFVDGNNIILKNHVNQIEVLKYCDTFITHGGMNSVNEALYWGVPLCVYPFQIEQEEVANRVVELNCGILIKKLSKKFIRQSVMEIINNEQFKKNCKNISKSFKDAGGYKRGVEVIKQYTKD